MSAAGPDVRIAAAQAEAAAARRRLGATVDVLKHRVSPQVLAQNATDTLKDKGAALVSDVTGSMKRRPAAYAAAAVGLALFLARRPLAGLVRRATGPSPDRSTAHPKIRKGSPK